MADINVERKRGPGIWPWIIGLIILALILWWLFARGGDNRGEEINAVDTTVVSDTTTAMPAMPMDTMTGGGMGAMPVDTMTGGAPPPPPADTTM